MASIKTDNSPPISVSITKSISVYPKAFTEPSKILTLSNLDRQCPTLMYMVFFYKFPNSDDHKKMCFDSVFDRLKSGLEETLSVYYPAAGRLRHDGNGKLDIWCNNGGAILVEGMIGCKICELGDLSLYNELYEDLVFKPVVSDDDGNNNITEMPLVTAQVTRFECGGYSIGIGSSHSLFDGISAYEFLHAWASNTKPAGSCSESLMYQPVHERGSLLLAPQNNNNNNNNNNNQPSPTTAIHHLYELIKQLHTSIPDDQVKIPDLVYKTFHLSTELIENLKKKVILEDGFSCSTFELLAAHLWKVRTKALGLKSNRKVCLQFAVDARNRMAPPLPKGFSGNAYVLASVLTTAGELEENTHQFIINQIKEAKNAVTHAYVVAYMEALELGPQNTTLPPLPELTIVSDWTRVPFHRVDFMGEEAAYASPLVPPVQHVAYFMQSPNCECKQVDLRIGLLPSTEAYFSHNFINI